MTVALTLLVSGLTLAVVGPWFLTRSRLHAVGPGVLLAAWAASMASLTFFLVSAVVVAAWPRHAPAEGAVETMLSCLAALTHTLTPWVDDTIAVASTLALAALTTHSVRVVWHQVRARDHATAQHADTVRILGRRDARVDTVWLPHATPLAYSIGGRAGLVVATDGLAVHLSEREVAAVMAHERAHLSGRHHRVVALTAALARALSAVPLFSRAPAAVGMLLELAADRAAVRATDAATVRSALVTVAAFSGATPAGSLGLANTALQERLVQLDGAPPASGWSTAVRCLTAAALTVLAPAAAASVTVLGVTSGVCYLL